MIRLGYVGSCQRLRGQPGGCAGSRAGQYAARPRAPHLEDYQVLARSPTFTGSHRAREAVPFGYTPAKPAQARFAKCHLTTQTEPI